MHTSPILIIFLAYQDHLGHLYYLTSMDAYSSDKMDVYQWCNVSKFSKFYTFPIPYSYINASLLLDHHHLKRKLQHAAAITGCVFSRHQLTLQTKTMCHSMHQAFRYMLINQSEFLDNSGEKKKWGKISSLGKKTLNFKEAGSRYATGKEFACYHKTTAKQRISRTILPTELKLPPEQMALMPWQTPA